MNPPEDFRYTQSVVLNIKSNRHEIGMETKQVQERVGQTFLQFIHLQKHLRSRGADIWHVKVGFFLCVFLRGLLLSSPRT